MRDRIAWRETEVSIMPRPHSSEISIFPARSTIRGKTASAGAQRSRLCVHPLNINGKCSMKPLLATNGSWPRRPRRCASSSRSPLTKAAAAACIPMFQATEFSRKCLLVTLYNPAAQMNEDFRNIDLDRADLIAGAAQRRCIGQRISVAEVAIFRLMQLRSKNRADRPGVDRGIGVAAGLAIDRAGIQARGATNALQRLLRFGVMQDGAASVVEQDDVKFLRPIAGVRRRSRSSCRGSFARRLRSAAAFEGRPRGPESAGSPSRFRRWRSARSGRVRHMRPLPSDSTMHTLPVSATRKLAPLTADFDAQEFLAQIPARGGGKVFRRVAELRSASSRE